MPAPVLIVHQESETRELLLAVVQAAGYKSVGFDGPLKALGAIERDSRVRVVVTPVNFGPGQLNGVSLARMLRLKRHDVKMIFVGRPEDAQFIDGLGEFLPHPADVQAILDAVGRLLATTE